MRTRSPYKVLNKKRSKGMLKLILKIINQSSKKQFRKNLVGDSGNDKNLFLNKKIKDKTIPKVIKNFQLSKSVSLYFI